jgi:hypothetical protein
MKKIDKHLLDQPAAKRHGKVIKATLKALEDLKSVGVTARGYALGSTYGGSKRPADSSTRKLGPGVKMTYCA